MRKKMKKGGGERPNIKFEEISDVSFTELLHTTFYVFSESKSDFCKGDLAGDLAETWFFTNFKENECVRR